MIIKFPGQLMAKVVIQPAIHFSKSLDIMTRPLDVIPPEDVDIVKNVCWDLAGHIILIPDLHRADVSRCRSVKSALAMENSLRIVDAVTAHRSQMLDAAVALF